MANIIIIDDDDKIIRDMTNYINEMGDNHNIRHFPTPELFIKKYTKHTKAEDDEVFRNSESLKLYDLEALEKLMTLEIEPSEAFKGKQVVLQLNNENFSVKKISSSAPSSLFRTNPDLIIDNVEFFEKIIHPEYLNIWAQVKQIITKDEDEVQCFLPVINDNKIWFIHFKITDQEEHYALTITDLSQDSQLILKKVFNERKKESEAGEFEMLSEIDLVLFATTLIPGEITQWVTKTWKHLKANEFFPEGNMTRFIAVKYEDDGLVKSQLSHILIEDLILLPLDRMIFKQKVEIVLNLPQKIKASYLFSQPVKMDIEISKKILIEDISDLFLTIKNPVPLKLGLFSIFYINLPTLKEPLKLTTKTSSCKKHPKDKNSYLITFDFFAVDKDTILKVKAFLRAKHSFHDLISTDEDDFCYFEENIFLSDEDRRIKNIVILEPDREIQRSISQSVSENIQHVRIINESSYFIFDKKYLNEKQPIALSVTDIYDKQIIWKIETDSFDLLEVVNQPQEEDLICGAPAASYFETPNGWWSILGNDEAALSNLTEQLKSIHLTKKVELILEILHADGTPRIAKLDITLDPEGHIEIHLSPPDSQTIEVEHFDSIDAIIINSNLVPTLTDEWIESLNEKALNKNLIKGNHKIKIIVLADSLPKDKKATYCHSDIDAIVFKPIETKALCYQVSRLALVDFTRFNPKNIGFAHVSLSGYAAKEAKLEELSEFGATLKHIRPLKPGSIVFFHNGIFENAPNGSLCARVYHCEPHPEESNFFHCFFLYFGINDSFLKYTRSWIRENYASQKSSGN